MPVDDVNSAMQLRQQLSQQIEQLNAMLSQNPGIGNMMAPGSRAPGAMAPGTMNNMMQGTPPVTGFNGSVPPPSWNNQVRKHAQFSVVLAFLLFGFC